MLRAPESLASRGSGKTRRFSLCLPDDLVHLARLLSELERRCGICPGAGPAGDGEAAERIDRPERDRPAATSAFRQLQFAEGPQVEGAGPAGERAGGEDEHAFV